MAEFHTDPGLVDIFKFIFNTWAKPIHDVPSSVTMFIKFEFAFIFIPADVSIAKTVTQCT